MRAETYTLEETLVPDNSGYVPANAIQFTVEDNGKVQHVIMQDDYTKVQISKTDIATGKEISGAKLKITDADGKTVAEWVTDGTPHYMERIPMGTYTLTETVAPIEQGYVRAESVTFEVGPTENIQRVEMKDDFTKVEIFKADMTDGHELPGAKLKNHRCQRQHHCRVGNQRPAPPHRAPEARRLYADRNCRPGRVSAQRRGSLHRAGNRGNSESHDVRCPGALADPHET